MMTHEELHELLDTLHDRYNRPEFIEADPISVPHAFSRPEDIEISGFLAATIAWGNRRTIVRNARRLLALMDGAPHDFTLNATEREMLPLLNFVHRTFNGTDAVAFVRALRPFYADGGTLGDFFAAEYARHGDMRPVLAAFRERFFAGEHPPRCEKHLSSAASGAACKRLNMYVKWMVRRDDRGVDFGLWNGVPASALYLPLDVHTAGMGRALGLLTRRQNDWRAVEEITAALRRFDPADPVRYDFALFGAGISGYLK